ncbi:hypothetical protein OAR00_00325 [Alphaproteobacteria bacterium]|nr:hypothetical protein [Alphaproteobacteria bacterium]|tara:strand:+ start:103 stop:438 length:336 start_codon:yes stop_codon:yes gene_type:complete
METTNYQEELFCSVVEILEKRISTPYNFNNEIVTYNDLAKVLNDKGYKTERGRYFNKENLKKFFQNIDKNYYRENYLPECIDDDSWEINYSKFEDLIFLKNPFAIKSALGV